MPRTGDGAIGLKTQSYNWMRAWDTEDAFFQSFQVLA